PLGAVGHAVRRHEQPRRAARGDDPGRGGARPGPRPRLDRAGQARRPHRLRREPARGHPQHQHDPLRDEERPALRGRHAERGLAAAAGSARRAVAPHGARRRQRHPGRCTVSRATLILRAASAALVLAGVATAPAAAQGPPMMRPGGPGGQRESPLPLNGSRKASFTATRGTWISLDVSPDGQTIVFDLLGDLYTMPITGGKAKRLTSGLAYDAQPRFSPDGKRIVFISDRSGGDNVWVMSLDMVDTIQVTQGNTSMYFSPEWMPDGEMIVVSRSGGLGGAAKLEFRHVD